MSRTVALALLGLLMALNAFWNYTFFRLENLRLSFGLSLVYGVVAIALLFCLTSHDYVNALILLPYILYMFYSYGWGYSILQLNPELAKRLVLE